MAQNVKAKQGLTGRDGQPLKLQWKKWLYDDELERVAAIEKYLLELDHDRRILTAERRMLSMRGMNRAAWDLKRSEKLLADKAKGAKK